MVDITQDLRAERMGKNRLQRRLTWLGMTGKGGVEVGRRGEGQYSRVTDE